MELNLIETKRLLKSFGRDHAFYELTENYGFSEARARFLISFAQRYI
jgi:hypothetical protein